MLIIIKTSYVCVVNESNDQSKTWSWLIEVWNRVFNHIFKQIFRNDTKTWSAKLINKRHLLLKLFCRILIIICRILSPSTSILSNCLEDITTAKFTANFESVNAFSLNFSKSFLVKMKQRNLKLILGCTY